MNDVKHKLVLFYKISLGYAPQDLRDMVEPCMYFQNNYNLRTSNMTYRIPILRTTSYYNSFLPSTIKAWNELPKILKIALQLPNLNQSSTKIFQRKTNCLTMDQKRKYYTLSTEKQSK